MKHTYPIPLVMALCATGLLLGCPKANTPEPDPGPPSAPLSRPAQAELEADPRSRANRLLNLVAAWAKHPTSIGEVPFLSTNPELPTGAIIFSREEMTVRLDPALTSIRVKTKQIQSTADRPLPETIDGLPVQAGPRHYESLPAEAAILNALMWGWMYMPAEDPLFPQGLNHSLQIDLTPAARAAIRQSFPEMLVARNEDGAISMRVSANGQFYYWIGQRGTRELSTGSAQNEPQIGITRGVGLMTASDYGHDVQRMGLESLEGWTVLTTSWDDV